MHVKRDIHEIRETYELWNGETLMARIDGGSDRHQFQMALKADNVAPEIGATLNRWLIESAPPVIKRELLSNSRVGNSRMERRR